ncbi:MAG: outer membrane beta-barrel protein [Saprospiraceae bacterium]|nr:outer membrane beta-barrel protein [Saprospiraceae bacterium]
MQYLFRAKIIIGLLFFFCLSGIAQNTSRSINYYGFKKKSHYFGLTLAYNNSGFKIEHSKRFINNVNYRINDGVSSPGLTLGMITNFKIGQYFDYRILPSIALVYRKLSYQPLDNSPAKVDLIESVFGELPMMIRFTSDPYHDKKFYVATGVKYSYDFASNSRSDQDRFKIVRISPHDFQYEIGAGIQFYLPFFIFSPEIKYSHGLGNLLIYDGKIPESTIIEKLYSKSLTISFHFEG